MHAQTVSRNARFVLRTCGEARRFSTDRAGDVID